MPTDGATLTCKAEQTTMKSKPVVRQTASGLKQQKAVGHNSHKIHGKVFSQRQLYC